jgi:hypothetical protein
MLLGNNLDFGKLEARNMRLHNLSSAPSSPLEGQVYFDTTLHQLGCYQNTAWVYLGSGGGTTTNPLTVDNSSLQLDSGTTFNGSASRTISVKALGITNAMLAGSIAASKLVGSDIVTLGTITTGTWNGSVIGSAYGGAGTINGLLKANGSGTVSAATAGTDYVTGTSTNAFTNKTFDAAGTGNSLSNIATSMFASNVIDTDGTLTANSDTRLATQKAVKTYADALMQGLKWKDKAIAATTGAETYSITAGVVTQITGTSIDGVSPAVNDRIVIKNAPAASGAGAGSGTANTTQPANGIYTVTSNTTNLSVSRATDADTAAKIKSAVIEVDQGTLNADTALLLNTDSAITLNTTGLTFIDFVKANVPVATTTVAGKVTLATQAEAEAKSDTAKAVVSADLANFTLKKSFTIGDGSTTAIVVTHNLGTKDVHVMVRDFTTDVGILVDWTATSTNTVTITFAVAPASNAYRAVIIG